MGELKVKVPEELEEKFKEFAEWESMILEFIRLKIFEHELQKSKALQRFMLESLAAKSTLTPEDARELSQHTGWHAQIEPDIKDVTNPHAAAGDDEQLMLLRKLTDLLDQRNNDRRTVINDSVTTDLDDIELGSNSHLLTVLIPSQQPFPDQALSFQF